MSNKNALYTHQVCGILLKHHPSWQRRCPFSIFFAGWLIHRGHRGFPQFNNQQVNDGKWKCITIPANRFVIIPERAMRVCPKIECPNSNGLSLFSLPKIAIWRIRYIENFRQSHLSKQIVFSDFQDGSASTARQGRTRIFGAHFGLSAGVLQAKL